jgi:PAS domain S-box-containing protein
VPANSSQRGHGQGQEHARATDDAQRARELDALFDAALDEDKTSRALRWLLDALHSARVLLAQIDDYGELVIDSQLTAAPRDTLIQPDPIGLGIPVDEWRGVWGRALQELRVAIDNHACATCSKDFTYHRAIAAPLRFDGALIGLVFATDKSEDYTEPYERLLEQFARRAAPVLAYTLTQQRFVRQLTAAEEMASAAAEGERFFMMCRDPMVITDGRLRRANAAFTSLMGLRSAELTNRSLADLTHPKDRAMFERELHVMRTDPNREHAPVAVDMVTSSGERRRVEWVGAATHDGRVYAVGRDITVLSWAMEDLAITNAELQRLHAEARAEEQLAARVIAHVRKQGNLDAPGIKYVASPLGFFSGDVPLASYLPNGELRWLLGDFTGHGLAAAIGTVPLAGAFHLACRRDLPFYDMLRVLNDLLKGVLPPGLFCAAAWFNLSADGKTLSVFNCGLPPVLVRRGKTGEVEQLDSQSLPFGVLGSDELAITPTELQVESDDDVFVFTDGLTECTDASGRQFGIERVKAALGGGPHTLGPGEGFDTLMRAVASFRGQEQAKDDLSALCVSVGQTRAAAHDRENSLSQGSLSSAESSHR